MEIQEKEEILVNIFNQYGNFRNVDDIFPLEDSTAQQIKLCLLEAMDTVYERGKNNSNMQSNCNKPAVIGSLPSDKLYCEGDLFAAYLTGQQDVRDRSNGLDGRTFTAWIAENFPRQ